MGVTLKARAPSARDAPVRGGTRGRLCPELTAERREQLSTAYGDGDVPGRRAHGSGAAAVHAASPSQRLVQTEKVTRTQSGWGRGGSGQRNPM